MIRPPPLKLKYDNRFPLPLPSARKPKVQESFFQVLYKANWRNVVITIAGLNALRFAFATYNAFQDARVDKFEHQPRLVLVSVALCVMYALCCCIEIFGAIGISLRRLPLVRAFVFVEFVSALFATVASVLGAASFFLNAEALMYECVALAVTGQSDAKSQFRGRPWPTPMYPLGLRQAQKNCIAAWTQESWTQVINVFLFGFVPALVWYLMAYTYYRQTVDPGHGACLVSFQRVSSFTPRKENNGGYSMVPNADASYAGTTRSRTNNRGSLAGNPRSARLRAGRRSAAKVPVQTSLQFIPTTRGIKRSHCPPPLVELEGPVFTPPKGVMLQTSSALSFIFSPGLPSFGVNIVGPSRLGIGAYGPIANLSCSGNAMPSARFSKFV